MLACCKLFFPNTLKYLSHEQNRMSPILHFTIMYHINTNQGNTGTEQTLKGWMECVHIYLGGREPGEKNLPQRPGIL